MWDGERIVVNLCRPSYPIKQASVIPFHKISCLQKLYPAEPKLFILGGEILSPKMPSTFYQIQ